MAPPTSCLGCVFRKMAVTRFEYYNTSGPGRSWWDRPLAPSGIRVVSQALHIVQHLAIIFIYPTTYAAHSPSRVAGHEKGCSYSAGRRRYVLIIYTYGSTCWNALSVYVWDDRGCREKYDHNFTNQGVLRATCKQGNIQCRIGVVLNSKKVQHVVPEVTIPPETTPENVTTYIVDSGCMSLNIYWYDYAQSLW